MPPEAHPAARVIERAVLKMLTTTGREAVVRWQERRDNCVTIARVASHVLARFGIPAQVVPVRFHLMNRQMRELYEEHGRLPQTVAESRKWLEAGAYSVIVDDAPRPGRFNGHLILVTEHFVIDPSVDQASRPERGLVATPWFMPRPDGFPEKLQWLTLRSDSGAQLDYLVQDRPAADWTTLPDWQLITREHPVVHDLCELV
jgi:hypothetical protein